MLCENCGNQMVPTVGTVSTNFNFKTLELDDIPHYKCPECGFVGYSLEQAGDLSRKAAITYRDAHGLLTSDQIREIQEASGLDIQRFAKALWVSMPTAVKWENGTMVQSAHDDALIRKFAEDFKKPDVEAVPLWNVNAKDFGFLPCPFGYRLHFPTLSVFESKWDYIAIVKCAEHGLSFSDLGDDAGDLIVRLRDEWNNRYPLTDGDIRDAKLDAAAFDADEDWKDRYVIG